MKKQRHTPGPWRVTYDGTAYFVQEHLKTEVLSVDEHGNPCEWSKEREDNARLISAAPELLEALIMCCQSMSSVLPDFNPFDQAAYDKARAAIAKATGGLKA